LELALALLSVPPDFGMTMSDDGGFDEFDEFFFAAANADSAVANADSSCLIRSC